MRALGALLYSDRAMKFRYGISPQSLARWEAFERVRNVQASRGPEVGSSLMRFIVDAELEAIAQATAAEERHPELGHPVGLDSLQ